MRASLLAISKYAPAGISSNYIAVLKFGIAELPPRCTEAQHLRTGPEPCLNFVQDTKSEVRLRVCAYCICTRKSALHRILPRFQSPSKYPASGLEERLSGSFSSLHCMLSYVTHYCN